MSSLLEKAIIDATTLKEVAMKNAEQAIIDKYSVKIKEAIDHMLEQDDELDSELAADEMGGDELDPELGLGMDDEAGSSDVADDVPLAATDGEKLCMCKCPEEEEEVEIDFDELAKQIQSPEEEVPEETPEDFADELSNDEEEEAPLMERNRDSRKTVKIEPETMKDLVYGKGKEEKKEVDEDIELDEEEIKELAEELKVDAEVTPSGWQASNPVEDRLNKETAAAKVNDSTPSKEDKKEEKEEEIKDLKKENKKLQKNLVSSENKLKETEKLNEELKGHLLKVKDKLIEVNLLNAKLLYKNKTLTSTSLNERQKQSIVEAISKTNSVEEAKAIFETLQNTVGSKKENNSLPNSLREAISRKHSLLAARPRHSEDSLSNDPNSARWLTLAGINKK